MKDKTKPKFYYIYPLNNNKLKVFRKYIEENLKKGYIRPSQSSIGYPILFILKKDSKLRLYIHYRQLNIIIKKNCYLLQFINKLKNRLFEVQWFTTLDLPGIYRLIRIKERHEWKTAFRTKFKHFEYLILLFGLTNISTIFQAIINHILKKYIDKIIIIYLDNIFIFNKTLKKHKKYIHFILITLKQTNLYINTHKNTFYNQEIDYLEFKIKLRIIEINNKKIEIIKYWL